MRLLHTSDWHLGRSLHGEDLHAAQREAMEQLVAVVDEQAVDAVVVAGEPPTCHVTCWIAPSGIKPTTPS